MNKTSEINQNGLSPDKNSHLSVVKKIRLWSTRGLTNTQKQVLQRYLKFQSAYLTDQWLFVDDFIYVDVCLATHKSFFKNDLWIEASQTVVFCSSSEFAQLDYEHQVKISEIKTHLIQKLNHISKSAGQYAIDLKPAFNKSHVA